MTSVVEIERILSLCSEQLAVCASELNELKLFEKEHGLYKLGKAIVEINEVRSLIYGANPKLKPEHWDRPPTEEQYTAWFEEAIRIATEYSEEGQIDRAIRTIESFIFIGPSERIAERACQELERLRGENGS